METDACALCRDSAMCSQLAPAHLSASELGLLADAAAGDLSRICPCACTCMHVHAYPCICMHVHAYAGIPTYLPTYMHTHTYIHTSLHIHLYIHTCMHTRARAHIHTGTGVGVGAGVRAPAWVLAGAGARASMDRLTDLGLASERRRFAGVGAATCQATCSVQPWASALMENLHQPMRRIEEPCRPEPRPKKPHALKGW